MLNFWSMGRSFAAMKELTHIKSHWNRGPNSPATLRTTESISGVPFFTFYETTARKQRIATLAFIQIVLSNTYLNCFFKRFKETQTVNKLSTFSKITQAWQCLKIVLIRSDKLTYWILTSNYVLNLSYRPCYSRYKDFYYNPKSRLTAIQTKKSLNWDDIKILLFSVRWRNVLNFIFLQCSKTEIKTYHSDCNIFFYT